MIGGKITCIHIGISHMQCSAVLALPGIAIKPLCNKVLPFPISAPLIPILRLSVINDQFRWDIYCVHSKLPCDNTAQRAVPGSSALRKAPDSNYRLYVSK